MNIIWWQRNTNIQRHLFSSRSSTTTSSWSWSWSSTPSRAWSECYCILWWPRQAWCLGLGLAWVLWRHTAHTSATSEDLALALALALDIPWGSLCLLLLPLTFSVRKYNWGTDVEFPHQQLRSAPSQTNYPNISLLKLVGEILLED